MAANLNHLREQLDSKSSRSLRAVLPAAWMLFFPSHCFLLAHAARHCFLLAHSARQCFLLALLARQCFRFLLAHATRHCLLLAERTNQAKSLVRNAAETNQSKSPSPNHSKSIIRNAAETSQSLIHNAGEFNYSMYVCS